MPIVYEVEDGGGFVYTTASGDVTGEELLNYQRALLSDPRVKSGLDELFDATLAHETNLSEAVIKEMIAVDKAHAEKLRRGRCAIVVRRGYELAERFVSLHAGPHNVMVFYSLDVAKVWLGRKEGVTSG